MYSTLYNSRQLGPRYQPRQWYLDDATALPWVRTITIKATDQLNRQAARGLIYSHNKQTHGGMESFDYTIVIADNLPMEWERFVTIKELMHCYFGPHEKHVKYLTGSMLALEAHMNAFFGGSTEDPAPSRAEKMAVWMAVGVLCTENDRVAMSSTMNAEAIARQMRIPVKQAQNLVSNVYTREIQKLIV